MQMSIVILSIRTTLGMSWVALCLLDLGNCCARRRPMQICRHTVRQQPHPFRLWMLAGRCTNALCCVYIVSLCVCVYLNIVMIKVYSMGFECKCSADGFCIAIDEHVWTIFIQAVGKELRMLFNAAENSFVYVHLGDGFTKQFGVLKQFSQSNDTKWDAAWNATARDYQRASVELVARAVNRLNCRTTETEQTVFGAPPYCCGIAAGTPCSICVCASVDYVCIYAIAY